MEEIKVLVPEERVSEFYRWFADWSDGALTRPVGGPAALVEAAGGEPERLEAAVRFWQSLRPLERSIWGLWIDNAPRMLTAEEIVSELGLKGPRDIPGALSWSTRKGARAGFRATWRFRTDPITEGPIYGIEDEAYAQLLARARVAAEEAGR